MAGGEWLHHRPVQLSDEFVAKARELFPLGGSADGTPSYELFCESVLVAATLAFARDFERYGTEDGIGIVLTAETQVFRRPMAFYARLINNGAVVEMIDVEVDRDWEDWDLILGDDPDPR